MSTDEETKTSADERENTETETKEAPEPKAFSQEEVNSLIEKTRKQEKDKLYGTISELKETVESLAKAKEVESMEKKEIQEKAEKQAAKERQAQLSIEERLAEKMQSLEEKLGQAEKSRLELEANLAKEREVRELERFRQELLSNAGDDIIPDLVSGSSKEELENSVARAKDRYQNLFEAATAKAKGTAKREVTDQMPGPSDPTPAALEEAEMQQKLGTIDIDRDRYFGNRAKGIRADQDYVRKINDAREELKGKLANLYGKA